jgi:hypothetical protein
MKRVLGKIQEQVEGLGIQRYKLPIPLDLPQVVVDLESFKAENVFFLQQIQRLLKVEQLRKC